MSACRSLSALEVACTTLEIQLTVHYRMEFPFLIKDEQIF